MYLPALILIGGRQHALGALMHDGAHYRVSSSRRWHDWLSDYLAGYFVLAPTAGYRIFHLKHHRLLDTPDDPERNTIDKFPSEWAYPMPAKRIFFYLLRDFTGLWPKPVLALMGIVWGPLGRERWGHALRITALHSSCAYIAVVTGHVTTYLLLWWIPLLTVLPLCYRMRTAAEHSALDLETPRCTRAEVNILRTTRSVIASVPGRFMFGPHNIRLHIEHHLYPSVPYYRLPELHNILSANAEFVAHNRICTGYGDVLRELAGSAAYANELTRNRLTGDPTSSR